MAKERIKYVLVRPRIHWKKVIIAILFAALSCTGCAYVIAAVAYHFNAGDSLYKILRFLDYVYALHFTTLKARIAAAILLIELIIFRKKVVIFIIRLYQRFAPASVRERCLFEPCCSNYMIMSIEKYGFIKGIVKGAKRIRRCHPPNGGTDYP